MEMKDIDWLAIGIWNLGGIDKAAQRLGVTRGLLRKYLREGLGGARFDTVLKIHRLGRVPMECLVKCAETKRDAGKAA